GAPEQAAPSVERAEPRRAPVHRPAPDGSEPLTSSQTATAVARAAALAAKPVPEKPKRSLRDAIRAPLAGDAPSDPGDETGDEKPGRFAFLRFGKNKKDEATESNGADTSEPSLDAAPEPAEQAPSQQRASQEASFDAPLEPGSRRPRQFGADGPSGFVGARMAPSNGAGPTPEMDAEAPAPGDKQDFIAAARRAAQSAALAVDEPDVAEGAHAALAKQANESRIARLRRPVTLAAFALLVLFGGTQVYGLLMGGGNDPAPFESSETFEETLPGGSGPTDGGSPVAIVPLETPDASEPTLSLDPTQDGPQGLTPFDENAAVDLPTFSIEAAPQGDVVAQVLADIDTTGSTAIDAATSSLPGASELLDSLPENQFPETLRLAAASGDPQAQFEVAARYTDGRGTPIDLFSAAQWYAKAAGQGLAPAQYRLGSLYEKGQGVEKDLQMAKIWYERGAAQGNRKSMHNLAVLTAEGIDGEPDYEAAISWFRKAAELGLTDSQYNLGILYARGLGTEQNVAESYKWFAIAADGGDKDADSKRDDLATRLGEDTLIAAKLAAQSWEPQALLASANVIEPPAGGWGDVETVAAPFALEPATPDMIREAQTLLGGLGFPVGTADGIAGPRTLQAVKSFEQQNGMPVTGQINQTLLERLGQTNS
ncbi:MAG: SEL1-like repeat protein, partial [Pseudomonadota bacterium]